MTAGKGHIAIFGIKYFPSRGGTSRVVESLLRYLKDEYTITIYCYEHPRATENIPGVNTVTFPEPKVKNFGVFYYFLKCLIHVLTKGNYDLVHVHKTEAAYFAPFIRLRFPTIITSHEIPYKNNKWSWFAKIYFHLGEWLFMQASGVRTSISKTQCDYYEKKYRKPVLYISNGIEKPSIATDPDINLLLDKNQIKDDFIFFAARRIIPIKGCHHLIAALHQINYKGQVIIAGDTDQMKHYTNQLIESSRGLDLKFVGYIDSPPLLNALIKRATLFIFPSEIEGMSMMLLEVAMLGTPIICSDIPQNKIILNDEHVLFFQSKNSHDLANKLKYAFENKALMHAAAANAIGFVSKNYSIESVVSKYINLYNRHITPKRTHEYTKL